MLDVIGIVQHHDGITGTSKQHVADDYVKRIYKTIEEVNPVYYKIIQDLAEKIGYSSSDW